MDPDDNGLPMNPKEKKDLAVAKIVVLVISIIAIGVIIWLAWIRPAI